MGKERCGVLGELGTDTKLGKGQDGLVTEMRFWGKKKISGREKERGQSRRNQEKRDITYSFIQQIFNECPLRPSAALDASVNQRDKDPGLDGGYV